MSNHETILAALARHALDGGTPNQSSADNTDDNDFPVVVKAHQMLARVDPLPLLSDLSQGQITIFT